MSQQDENRMYCDHTLSDTHIFDATDIGLEILKPGMLSQLQDVGRVGFLRYGVSHAGVMDRYASAWANRLVGNPATMPLIEVTLGGLQFRSRIATWVSVTGATLDVRVDGHLQPKWSRFWVEVGQTISLGFASSGQRAYVAVAGGLMAPQVLNSVSTHQRNRLGGLKGNGQPLQQNDFIPLSCRHLLNSGNPSSHLIRRKETQSNAQESRNNNVDGKVTKMHYQYQGRYKHSARAHWEYIPDYSHDVTIRIQAGTDWRLLDHDQREKFLTQWWEISSQSDRMGIRLTHQTPIEGAPKRQLSLGITAGAIQLPPSGEPIILAADCQTMGGYPVIGWVHPLDMSLLAQMASHRKVRFTLVEIDDIQADIAKLDDFFSIIP